MKVLYLSDVYFPRVNGVSTSIRTFRDELREQGCEVTLVAPAYGIADVAEAGLIRVPARRVPFDPEDRMMRVAALRRPSRPRSGCKRWRAFWRGARPVRSRV